MDGLLYISGPEISTRDGAIKKEVKMPLFMEFLVKAMVGKDCIQVETTHTMLDCNTHSERENVSRKKEAQF